MHKQRAHDKMWHCHFVPGYSIKQKDKINFHQKGTHTNH